MCAQVQDRHGQAAGGRCSGVPRWNTRHRVPDGQGELLSRPVPHGEALHIASHSPWHAQDVAVFLAWASEPDHDDRKKYGFKWIVAMTAFVALLGFYKRFRCVRPPRPPPPSRTFTPIDPHLVCAGSAPSRTARSPTPTRLQLRWRGCMRCVVWGGGGGTTVLLRRQAGALTLPPPPPPLPHAHTQHTHTLC